ncbi:hypothetical protein [Pedobacter sp. NJ-S-72]
MNQMVERQMRASILAIGSFWYSAWVDAGQPKLEKMIKVSPDPAAEREITELNRKFSSGKIIGREN